MCPPLSVQLFNFILELNVFVLSASLEPLSRSLLLAWWCEGPGQGLIRSPGSSSGNDFCIARNAGMLAPS